MTKWRYTLLPPDAEIKWHYTIRLWLAAILKDGEIKTASDYITLGERPVVWFSTNPDWELTANKNLPDGDKVIFLDRAGTEKHYGLARIGVAPETAPHNWQALKELSGMPGKHAQGLYREAIKRGSRPGQWWGTFDPVPRDKWIAVQVYVSGKWTDIDTDEWMADVEIMKLTSEGENDNGRTETDN